MIFTALSGVCFGLGGAVAYVAVTRWESLTGTMRQMSIVTIGLYAWLALAVSILGNL